jgi:hypothetical protein
MRMVAVCAPDHVLRSSDHTGYVIDRYAELQQHRGAGMPQDMRGDLLAQPC